MLVTHGTDTMVETAQVLASITDKTIVLTGALNPARFRGSDAEFNIGTAVGAVQSLPPGVYIAMNGRIWDPARCARTSRPTASKQSAEKKTPALAGVVNQSTDAWNYGEIVAFRLTPE